METKTLPKIIHLARIQPQGGSVRYLFLRQQDPHRLMWYEQNGPDANDELETKISGSTIDDALQQARQKWKHDSFRTVICGFRYTLPERDEHGCNALFHQMVASYSSPNGIYFDEDLGHNCIVQFASQEARSIWERLKQSGQKP